MRERQLSESSKDKNEEELLSELISKYNGFRANSALRKWQISSDGHAAVWSIIIGMDETSRSLLRSHLDHNKWEESGASDSCDCLFLFAWVMCIFLEENPPAGYSESILRLKRHMLTNAPKGLSPFWEKLLTVPDLI